MDREMKHLLERRIEDMAVKHEVTINVAKPDGNTTTVLRGAGKRLPTRICKFLFGDFTQVYLLSPGQTVASVDVREVKEGGESYGATKGTRRSHWQDPCTCR